MQKLVPRTRRTGRAFVLTPALYGSGQMRIHHLNCGTDCPLGGALFDGRSLGPLGQIVCHCLLIETDAHGLVLVDTGYGLRDVAHPHRRPDPRITWPWRLMLNIRLREEE